MIRTGEKDDLTMWLSWLYDERLGTNESLGIHRYKDYEYVPECKRKIQFLSKKY